ncbi:MAG: hypothetical protein K0S44_1163 [Bacteroidetes bacterium]|jgi:site-specific recombinase XerD|nr:hypothetical protein [Bacteroidota bacterium]
MKVLAITTKEMATIKLTIDKRRKYNDGRQPIIFRVTSNSRSTSIDSCVKLFPKEWDNSKGKVNKIHPEHKSLNLLLKNKLFELEKRLLGADKTDGDSSVVSLVKVLLNKPNEDKITFKNFALLEIENLKKQKRFGNAEAYEGAMKRLIGFTGKEISLDQISYNVISDFNIQLLDEGVSKNTIAMYLREIRAILNLAIKRKLISRDCYPFYDFKIKTEKTVNRAIKKEHLKNLIAYPLKENTVQWHSRNIFFLIFYLIGISFLDLVLLKPENIHGDRIMYKRRKTGKMYSIKIIPEAQRLINFYINDGTKYLISYFRFDNVDPKDYRKVTGLRIRSVNDALQRIGIKCNMPFELTTYVARYSWANIAKSLGYPKDQIAEALGHEYGNRVTGIYLDNYGSEVIDEMNERVTGETQ